MNPPPEEVYTHYSAPEYIAAVLENAPTGLASSFSAPVLSSTRIHYIGSEQYRHIDLDPANPTEKLLEQAERDDEQHHLAVCIVENISPAHIGAVGPAWNINPSFFTNHACDLDHDEFYNRVNFPVDFFDSSRCFHVDGMFMYPVEKHHVSTNIWRPNVFPRHSHRLGPDWVRVGTRISYCRVRPLLCMLLSLIYRVGHVQGQWTGA